jgi:endonuclease YncB( thermonuclease family)
LNLAVLLTVVAVLTACTGTQRSETTRSSETGVVARVNDGDTLTLRGGRKVRLLQIDTPELGAGECYSEAAWMALRRLAPIGTSVVLESDPALDRTDRYGRLLRYVKREGVNVNIELVRLGAAAPYFQRGNRGRYAAGLMRAVRNARATKQGLWKACPATVLEPNRAVSTGRRP